jgi:hypothetical protein
MESERDSAVAGFSEPGRSLNPVEGEATFPGSRPPGSLNPATTATTPRVDSSDLRGAAFAGPTLSATHSCDLTWFVFMPSILSPSRQFP